jgi:hypothetical protein
MQLPHWLHSVGKKCLRVFGNFPFSTIRTIVRHLPNPTLFSVLQATVQA